MRLICLPPSDAAVPDVKWNSMSGKSSDLFAYFVLMKASPSIPPNTVRGPGKNRKKKKVRKYKREVGPTRYGRAQDEWGEER